MTPTVDEFLSRIGTIPQVIDKDECIYCFETVYNKVDEEDHHSLNICLQCFQAVCARDVSLHQKVTQLSQGAEHTQYLNVSKRAKGEEGHESDEASKSKKLKLQVIEKSEDELYHTLWSLVNIANGTTTVVSAETDAQGTAPEIVQKILNAKSQASVNQVHSWELQLKSCQHVQSLQPNVETQTIDLSHCFDCELNSNLWLCLHCGHVGCGRQQVGIDGNTHALAHYDSCKTHPLAIKLGSLSESSYDLYCYGCDDEVKFDDSQQLNKVLASYGIDPSMGNATEKTLTELQVEQNMNWDFQMTDESGHELVKLNPSKEVGCGLINMGNSCYLNSVLQCLFQDETWTGKLQMAVGEEFPTDVVFPSNNLRCQLIKLYRAMKLEPELYPQGIKPQSFKKCFSAGHEEFASQRQQDAMEFLTYMIDNLDKKLSPTCPGDTFKFQMCSRIECTECHGVKYVPEQAECIQIPLEENKDKQSLTERLSNVFEPETIEFKCPACKSRRSAIKKTFIETSPDVLILNPIRIGIDRTTWQPVKTSAELTFNETESLSPFVFERPTDGEKLLPEEEDDAVAFTPREDTMAQLMEMGFSSNAAIRSLYHTGNVPDGEVALSWLFEHVEDADINEPFTPPSKDDKGGLTVDPAALEQMVSMGLDAKLCRKALLQYLNDVASSVEWVFSHPDDDGSLETETAPQDTANAARKFGHPGGSIYKLYGIVCHKGNSTQSGHYVAYIRQRDGQWTLYNDEKIVCVESLDEALRNGYIFLYKLC
ncbi:ubiquitin-specific protease UBP14 KNAG_0J00800 [Huiozyma naganishii CBS 8797]|uniref:Ubiquitin carboxyl-terminal hydrolase n=1 Tax=Huiozyma naganishii (strain ATCC MYA-139 / BCRC 22969 / CBS 8797 / KCTC 17520 / NBRC 10181 / NCYC 3082 / Yp74L-3) TaxID=1071383 RepID=J7S2P2_HUIN7|nr:hypothetical protein KNAG_0J00800 [Kazachstania naganishii CBS 8797]CCK72162.1 hypothetical protein KNAG_0J00800 [Kazachstania naganishii CBS 8797]